MWLASYFTGELAAVGLAAFLGHLYPVFHRFQGGKGVATAAGVLLALDWRVGLGTIVTWLVIASSRATSLAALVAALFALSATAFLLDLEERAVRRGDVRLPGVAAQGQHPRLLAGTEPRLGAKKATPSDPSAASR